MATKWPQDNSPKHFQTQTVRHAPKQTSLPRNHRCIQWAARNTFQYPSLISERMYENDCEMSAPRAHLALSPIAVETEPRLIVLVNVLVSSILSVNPYSPATLHTTSSCCFVFSPLMNNQRRSCYCTYEINLLPAAHRVMLLQENQCPSCCSLGLNRVYAHLLS